MRLAIHDIFKDQIYKILDMENEGFKILLSKPDVGIAAAARREKKEPIFKGK
jgi:hypothetical protein